MPGELCLQRLRLRCLRGFLQQDRDPEEDPGFPPDGSWWQSRRGVEDDPVTPGGNVVRISGGALPEVVLCRRRTRNTGPPDLRGSPRRSLQS